MAKQSVTAAARRAFYIEGIDELNIEIGKLLLDVQGQSVGKDMKDVFIKAAVEVRDEARTNVRDKTGNLRRGIFAARGDSNKPSALVGVNYAIAPHAHLVEFGHAGPRPAPPHPYMRPAVAAKKERVKQIMIDGLAEIIRRYK